MPYTIHIAEDEAEARGTAPEISLSWQVHEAIFRSGVALHDLTLFYHLSDFYQNAAFEGDHVLSLRIEVEEARRRITTPIATTPLSELSKLCDRAVKKQLNLYAFGE